MNVVSFATVPLLFTFVRSAVDAFGVLGFGHYLMSRRVAPSKLLLVSTLAGAICIPARFLPISPVTQAYLCALIAMVISVWTHVSDLLTSAGSVMLGSSTLLACQHAMEKALVLVGRDPGPLSLYRSLVVYFPSSIALAVLSYLCATRLPEWPPVFTLQLEEPAEDSGEGHWVGELGPLARMFTAMVLVMAFSGVVLKSELPAWVALGATQTVPVFLFALIIWVSSHHNKPVVEGVGFAPVDFLDLGLLPALTHAVLVYTGGAFSPYSALYIPLVVTNSLKKGRFRGFLSSALSLASITVLGLRARSTTGTWTTDSNVVMGLVYVLTFYLADRFSQTEASLRKSLVEKASLDDLTRLFNHGFIHSYLDKVLSAKTGTDTTYLIMIDLDNFKILNDCLGHLDGDALLREIAQNLRGTLRARDVIARYGGDEFVVVPSGAESAEQVVALADRIRSSIERTCTQFAADRHLVLKTGVLTASAGIACTTEWIRDKESLIRAADQALYIAKARGKNQAIVAA